MDMDYITFGGGATVGCFIIMLTIYLIYRRGIVIRLSVIVLSCALVPAIMGFILGKEGITVGRVSIAVVVGASFLVSLFVVMIRQIINPIKQMANVAKGISKGDLNQTITVENKDEIGGIAIASTQMIAYLQQVAEAADRLAQGDLTTSITPQSNKDVLGHAFSQMMINLSNLIGQVQQSADQVASASQQLNTTAEQASQAAQQVSTTIQQVTEGTNQQTQTVTEATGHVEQIARAAEGIARGSQEQAQGVQKTSGLINEMANSIETVMQTGQGMDTIRARTTVAMEKVNDMGSHSKKIGRIVETIDDIADKTDMLALNAAVEAARAGEHGRGFAVVADQVRKLSEDSKNATRDINELIEQVQEAINEAIAAMASTATEVDNGTRQINEAVSQLKQKSEEVVAAIESVSTVVEENTAVAEEMAANSQEVTTAMEGVANIAEENSASAEEVSASAEEMSSQAEEVVASAEELAALAGQLREVTAQFRVDGSGIELKRPAHRPEMAPVPARQQQRAARAVPAGHQNDGHSTEAQ
jgi:methyl-accepting chemotaxis protein